MHEIGGTWYTSHTWRIFAHEIGHNFGAHHSFEEGQGTTGRIMDYGKYAFEQNKKKHAAKRKQKQIHVKEIKFRPSTEENDYQVKLQSLIKFLTNGDKVKVTLRFRGREMAHQEYGSRMLERIQNDLDDYGVVEQLPKLEGRQMVMVYTPKK